MTPSFSVALSKRRFVAVFALAAIGWGMGFTSFASSPDDLAPCVVFIHDIPPAGATEKHAGSGFLVKRDENVYLVTAAHVARSVGPDWKLTVQGADGKPATAQVQSHEWRYSAQHDVAVLPIRPGEHKAFLLARSLPMNFLSARPLPPSRDVTLTVMGYPKGLVLDVDGYVSPLSFETKAASGFVTYKRGDNNQPATFIVLQDPSVGGLSGGPVFDTGQPYFFGERELRVRSGDSVVGLMHGAITDQGVGRLAVVVPASEIVTLLDAVANPPEPYEWFLFFLANLNL